MALENDASAIKYVSITLTKDDTEMTDTMPKPILAMLEEVWKETDGFSIYQHNRERKGKNASVYLYSKDEPDHDNNGVRTHEVASMADLPAFNGLIKKNSKGFAFNEHAQHALTEFCSDVYEAWRKCSKRLDEVRDECT